MSSSPLVAKAATGRAEQAAAMEAASRRLEFFIRDLLGLTVGTMFVVYCLVRFLCDGHTILPAFMGCQETDSI
jgi:hypothetical protein